MTYFPSTVLPAVISDYRDGDACRSLTKVSVSTEMYGASQVARLSDMILTCVIDTSERNICKSLLLQTPTTCGINILGPLK